MIETIYHAAQLLALIAGHRFNEPGIHFFTADDLSQQLAYMRLTRLFEDRQVADYDAIIVIRGDEATQDLTDARRIVETIRTHLTETSTGDIASGSPGA